MFAKIQIMLFLLVIVICGSASAADRQIMVKITGSGNDVEFDPRSIPAEMQQGYLAMETYCVTCHSQERMITTLKTGISPVTKHPYGEAEFTDKIIKIMRSPKSNLDRNHAKVLTDFFHFLINKVKLS